MPYIRSYTRNGTTYAEVRTSKRVKGQANPKSIPVYLGKVIDIKKGLFENKNLGVFHYNVESGLDICDINTQKSVSSYREEKSILDFGSSFTLAEFSKSIGFWDLFRKTLPRFEDSLMAMVFFYTEMARSNREAIRWLRGSFSSLLFPCAQLNSQRISELLIRLGDEVVVRDFFSRYLKADLPRDMKTGILIDSTGLPNAIHFPLTAVNTHNGETSEEVRLIFVVDKTTGMPLFFRYNAGNIVDITTLKATLNELSEYGVTVKHAIVDAGYCSENNITAMFDNKIRFLTRLPVNRKIYLEALDKYQNDVLSVQCRHMYQNRVIGIKRIYMNVYGHHGYLYLCVDYNRRNDQIRALTKKGLEKKTPINKRIAQDSKLGFFGLLSSDKIDPENILPLYYMRQSVEQVFDVTKNNVHILPLRTHNEDTFRGHIMLTFMSVILYLRLNKCFNGDTVFTAQNALDEMRNLKCKVYDNCVRIKEITKDMRTVCDKVGIKVPETIKLPIITTNQSEYCVAGKKGGK
jgi:hypothetical protein